MQCITTLGFSFAFCICCFFFLGGHSSLLSVLVCCQCVLHISVSLVLCCHCLLYCSFLLYQNSNLLFGVAPTFTWSINQWNKRTGNAFLLWWDCWNDLINVPFCLSVVYSVCVCLCAVISKDGYVNPVFNVRFTEVVPTVGGETVTTRMISAALRWAAVWVISMFH